MNRAQRPEEEMPGWSWGRRGTYGPTLRRLEDVTLEELAAAVAELPPDIRACLAEGPASYRYDCKVCESFPKPRKEWLEAADRSDPRYIVFGFHELPKAWCIDHDDQFYGDAANDIYDRCMAIYRAAGWQGEPKPANA